MLEGLQVLHQQGGSQRKGGGGILLDLEPSTVPPHLNVH